ncbi:MAG: hypothetical protein ACLPLZ_08325 [Terracidiphilus sp.]
MRGNLVLAAIAMLLTPGCFASQLVYLSCDLPADKDTEASHFDFTLDEENGTVSFFVEAANATNTEKAIFGPETITWTNNGDYSTIARTISRVDLSFVEDTDIAGIKEHRVGKCSVVTPPSRKF